MESILKGIKCFLSKCKSVFFFKENPGFFGSPLVDNSISTFCVMLDRVVLFCHDGILCLSTTIVNNAGDAVYYLGFFLSGDKVQLQRDERN